MAAYGVYVKVWLFLVVLSVATWLVSYLRLGAMNAVVALCIASVKAALVALFFMHLRSERGLVWAFALFPIGFLGLLMAGTLADILLR